MHNVSFLRGWIFFLTGEDLCEQYIQTIAYMYIFINLVKRAYTVSTIAVAYYHT